jgi:hypothetical protein
MFGIIESTVKAASAVIDVPVSLAADVVTCGGLTTGKDKTYTGEALERLVQNVSDISDPKGGMK